MEKEEAGRMLEYYGRRAPEYEAIYQKSERQDDLVLLRRDLPRLLAGEDVLEVACGTGYWTELLAPHVASLCATDLSAEVLTIARSKSYPPNRVRFVRADAFELDAVGDGFTGAFVGFWWSHVKKEDLPRFLQGLHARLAPGARVVVVDNRYVEGSSTPIARVDEEGNSYQIRTLGDGTRHEVLKNFPSSEELRQLVMETASDPQVVELAYYWYLHYRVAELR